jgi:hypothetical protein
MSSADIAEVAEKLTPYEQALMRSITETRLGVRLLRERDIPLSNNLARKGFVRRELINEREWWHTLLNLRTTMIKLTASGEVIAQHLNGTATASGDKTTEAKDHG